jgi:hypothetical protein
VPLLPLFLTLSNWSISVKVDEMSTFSGKGRCSEKRLNAAKEIWKPEQVADYETLNHGRNLKNDENYRADHF